MRPERTVALGRVSRRAFLTLAAGFAATPALAQHPAIVYMNKVARDLLNANRQGTVASFRQAIIRHADVKDIGNYSLGQYQARLPASQRAQYYGGVANFMARYLAEQSQEYHVAKYEIGNVSGGGDKDVTIDTKVYLMSGETYTVGWRLAWHDGRYRVTDVKVLGFSMIYMQRGLFTAYISKRNGDVGQLVMALNR
jgi:phospholipid transport system substrate-binding protein